MASGALHYEFSHGVHAVKSTYAANKPLWVHVIEGDRALWVDTGINCTPADVVIPCLKERAPQVWQSAQLALITHADVDHFGGIRGLKTQRPDTLIFAQAADKAWIESPEAVLRERYEMHREDGITLTAERKAVLNERGGGGGKVDVTLRNGEEFDLGSGGVWRVLHLPGHSAGHVILYSAERDCAIIGDAVLDWGVPDDTGRLIAPPPYYHLEAYLTTIAVLEALDAEVFFTSHYGTLDREGARRLLQNSRDAAGRLETAIEIALHERPEGWSLADLCGRTGELAKHWEPHLWPALCDPVSAHLWRGMESGEIVRTTADGRRIYRRAGACP